MLLTNVLAISRANQRGFDEAVLHRDGVVTECSRCSLFIVRDGVHRDIPYELHGRFEVDIPLAPALSFRNDGRIRLQATEIAAKRRH